MNITPTFRTGPTYGREDDSDLAPFVREAYVNITFAATFLNQTPRRPRFSLARARMVYAVALTTLLIVDSDEVINSFSSVNIFFNCHSFRKIISNYLS